MNQNKHNTPNKNLKTNQNSQKTTNRIILVNKLTILVYKIIVLVKTYDYFGLRAKFIHVSYFVKATYNTAALLFEVHLKNITQGLLSSCIL